MTPLRLALLSLTRHRFATAITVIAIGLSVACGGILLRLYELSESRFSAMGSGGDAMVGAKAGGIEILLGGLNGEGSFPDFVPYKLFESLRVEQAVRFEDGASTKPSFIESVIPLVYFGKFGGYRLAGTDGSFFHRPRSESLTFAQGRLFESSGEVVLGAAVAQSLGLKVGDTITVQGWRDDSPPSNLTLTVVGVLHPTGTQWDRTLYSSLDQAWSFFAESSAMIARKSIWGPQVLHYFLVYLKPGGFDGLETLVNRRTVAQAIRISDQKDRLQELSGAGRNVGLLVTSFVIALGALAVCAMLMTRFEGMSTQLAVLRALGYHKSEIARWLLWEGVLMGAMGLVLGALLDLMALPLLRSQLGSALPPAELVPSSLLISAPIWLAALLSTVAAVLIPLIRMGRQNTHDALKGI
ncbi:MAG: ABC transporter permease [Bdellovibrionaceae bacterium]|nr:ABC transporter permease [Pseudobdellovibrionaceae bacterium]